MSEEWREQRKKPQREQVGGFSALKATGALGESNGHREETQRKKTFSALEIRTIKAERG